MATLYDQLLPLVRRKYEFLSMPDNDKDDPITVDWMTALDITEEHMKEAAQRYGTYQCSQCAYKLSFDDFHYGKGRVMHSDYPGDGELMCDDCKTKGNYKCDCFFCEEHKTSVVEPEDGQGDDLKVADRVKKRHRMMATQKKKQSDDEDEEGDYAYARAVAVECDKDAEHQFTMELTMAAGSSQWWDYIVECDKDGEQQRVFIVNHTGRHLQDGLLYFNDENSNRVQVLYEPKDGWTEFHMYTAEL